MRLAQLISRVKKKTLETFHTSEIKRVIEERNQLTLDEIDIVAIGSPPDDEEIEHHSFTTTKEEIKSDNEDDYIATATADIDYDLDEKDTDEEVDVEEEEEDEEDAEVDAEDVEVEVEAEADVEEDDEVLDDEIEILEVDEQEEIDILNDDNDEDEDDAVADEEEQKRPKKKRKPNSNKKKKKEVSKQHQQFARYQSRMKSLPKSSFTMLTGVYLSDYGLSTAVRKYNKSVKQDSNANSIGTKTPFQHHAQILEMIATQYGISIKGFTSENKKKGKYEELPNGDKREELGGTARIVYVGKLTKARRDTDNPCNIFCILPDEE